MADLLPPRAERAVHRTPPVIIARRGAWLAGLLLTSKAPGAGPQRVFMDVGVGAWDRQQRPSQVRLDRLLDVDPAKVRREGAAIDRALFERVVAEASRFLPELRSHPGRS